MIETDPKLLRTLENLSERPVLDTRAMIVDVERLMHDTPTVRLGPRMEELRISLAVSRSRLVGIKGQLLLEQGYLKRASKAMHDYLNARYINHLGSVKNQHGRAALVAKATSPFERRLGPIVGALEFVDLALNDYDSRGFAFRDVVSAQKLGDRDI